METKKAYVDVDGKVTLICPACSVPKSTSVASFKGKCHFLKVRCPCGNVFRVQLDFRQQHRKTTDLQGVYVCVKPPGLGGGRMTVKDISRGGVGIEVIESHNLQVGCILEITFNLDDRKKTQIKKKTVVRSITDNFIGCQFTDEELYEKEIGFYLIS